MKGDYMSGLAGRLKELRTKNRLTQAELGAKLGISPSTVGMYEQGRREPDARILMEMSRLFGVSTDYLLSGRGEDEGPCEVEKALHELCEHMKTGGLMFNGTLLNERDTQKLFDAMLLAANLMFKEGGKPE